MRSHVVGPFHPRCLIKYGDPVLFAQSDGMAGTAGIRLFHINIKDTRGCRRKRKSFTTHNLQRISNEIQRLDGGSIPFSYFGIQLNQMSIVRSSLLGLTVDLVRLVLRDIFKGEEIAEK